ncbi:hypothetical protein PQR72_13635 [Paraburkholderia madseniana]|uniref:hypothetical protein n=1 Tax=Paraburkholderia madseniana TaxID=2599607 RepID=UPI0015C57BB0|nr:hypothetical protein [Paraburkholderia madseniana]NPT65262.1 hypothetical protein [Paraburkholderia madseniana]
MKALKRKGACDEAPHLNHYEMELARGASHIASVMYEETMHSAVRETVFLFEALHGRDDLKAFSDALIGRLEQRGKPAAVKVLRYFIEHGRLPEQTLSAPTRPVSTRKPVAQTLRGTKSGKIDARGKAKAA